MCRGKLLIVHGASKRNAVEALHRQPEWLSCKLWCCMKGPRTLGQGLYSFAFACTMYDHHQLASL